MSRQILLVDNYDSFVFNLSRYFQELGCETNVVRNDRLNWNEIDSNPPQAIVISPGPCSPREAGMSVELVERYSAKIPILGVCLGHQVIASAFRGKVVRAPKPIHGQASWIHHDQTRLFEGCPNPLRVARYHSLIVDPTSLPSELAVTSTTEDGLIMSFRHCEHPVFGVQFHPESVLTSCGHRLLVNFLNLANISSVLPDAMREHDSELEVNSDFFSREIAGELGRPM
ncbi:Aminodeoxychorismate/anthranilate synthase component 2 [Thalassoglobus neptunius]|uniref:Aminodeoxychorismate/anthranilate synthase component 2 n=1 Tax=Thalassoglobus neptunius TaxID=1938619 RepID=A0A5C5VTI1_9PLAN|nr:aminodeoxychorismate/anthranilate synthase component II [Thalassoglobus neptunius]TWT41650.1 Aminodeoxychorismate/anthranilate synthase component 2 [Thalassoglobus neptunius]